MSNRLKRSHRRRPRDSQACAFLRRRFGRSERRSEQKRIQHVHLISLQLILLYTLSIGRVWWFSLCFLVVLFVADDKIKSIQRIIDKEKRSSVGTFRRRHRYWHRCVQPMAPVDYVDSHVPVVRRWSRMTERVVRLRRQRESESELSDPMVRCQSFFG